MIFLWQNVCSIFNQNAHWMATIHSPFHPLKSTSPHFFPHANNFRPLKFSVFGPTMSIRRFENGEIPIYFPKIVNAIMAIQRLHVSRTQMSFCFFLLFRSFSYRYFAYLSVRASETSVRVVVEWTLATVTRALFAERERRMEWKIVQGIYLYLWLKAQRSSRLESRANAAYSVMACKSNPFVCLCFSFPARGCKGRPTACVFEWNRKCQLRVCPRDENVLRWWRERYEWDAHHCEFEIVVSVYAFYIESRYVIFRSDYCSFVVHNARRNMYYVVCGRCILNALPSYPQNSVGFAYIFFLSSVQWIPCASSLSHFTFVFIGQKKNGYILHCQLKWLDNISSKPTSILFFAIGFGASVERRLNLKDITCNRLK